VRGLLLRALLAQVEAEAGAPVAAQTLAALGLGRLAEDSLHTPADVLRTVRAAALALSDLPGGEPAALRRLGRAVVEAFHRQSAIRMGGGQGLAPASASGFPALRALAGDSAWAVLPTGASSLLLQVEGEPLPVALLEGALVAELAQRGLKGEVVSQPLLPGTCHYLVCWLDPRARSHRG
jgi:hypothetical protein